MLSWLFGRLEDDFIVIEPGGGLGDRMNALEGAILLGRDLGRRVYLGWVLNDALRCRFGELFERPDEFEVLKYPVRDRNPDWFNHPLPRLAARLSVGAGWWLNLTRERFLLRYRYQFDAFLKPHLKAKESGDGSKELVGMPLLRALKAKRRIYFNTYLNAYRVLNPGAPMRRYDHLRPVAELRERIEGIAEGFKGRTVGVHIRQGDVPFWRRRAYPVSAIIRLMREEVARDSSVQFYLATESQTIISRLRVLFGDRIMTQPGLALGRGDAAGMKSAVVDMWALGRTGKIIGGRSQFTWMAAQLEGAELQIAHAPSSAAEVAGATGAGMEAGAV